jgi:hypothetical protein
MTIFIILLVCVYLCKSWKTVKTSVDINPKQKKESKLPRLQKIFIFFFVERLPVLTSLSKS